MSQPRKILSLADLDEKQIDEARNIILNTKLFLERMQIKHSKESKAVVENFNNYIACTLKIEDLFFDASRSRYRNLFSSPAQGNPYMILKYLFALPKEVKISECHAELKKITALPSAKLDKLMKYMHELEVITAGLLKAVDNWLKLKSKSGKDLSYKSQFIKHNELDPKSVLPIMLALKEHFSNLTSRTHELAKITNALYQFGFNNDIEANSKRDDDLDLHISIKR